MTSCPAFLHLIRLILFSYWFKISTKFFKFYLLCSLFVSYSFPLSLSRSSVSCTYHTVTLLSSWATDVSSPWTRWLSLCPSEECEPYLGSALHKAWLHKNKAVWELPSCWWIFGTFSLSPRNKLKLDVNTFFSQLWMLICKRQEKHRAG